MTEVRPMRELAPHLVWEAVLLLAAGAVVAGLYNANSAVFTRGLFWAGIAILGFAACGLALSLRTATPNLAITPIAVLAGWVFAEQANDGAGVAAAFIVALLAAAGVGLVLALVVGLTALPGWAVTLGGGFIVSAGLLKASGGQLTPLTRDARLTDGFGLWAAAFVVVSIAGAAVFALPAVRRVLTANRPAPGGDDPARWRPAKLVGALVGVGGSAVLAGVSGVLTTRLTSAALGVDTGQLPYVLAAVLLGGVSVFGRRAGVFGVVLGVVIVDGVRRWQQLEAADSATALLTTGALAVVGMIVVWLLELIGRRVAPLPALAAAGAPSGAFLVAGAPGYPPAVSGFPPPVHDGGFPQGAPVSGAPVPPTYPSGPVGSPAGVAPQSGIPAPVPPAGYPAPPPPTSGGPAFGQPTYPGTPPVSGPPGYPPGPQYGGPPQPSPNAEPPGRQGDVIPQPWTVPGVGGAAPQIPSQPVSPISGPPHWDPPPSSPRTPPPSWPPQN